MTRKASDPTPTSAQVHSSRDSLPRRFARRLVSIPGYAVLATLCVGTVPVSLPAALLHDALRDRRRWPATRALLFFAVYLTTEVVFVVLAFFSWLLGGASFGEPTARTIHYDAALQRAFTGWLFHALLRIYGMRTEVSGLEHARKGPFLLFVQHQSKVDTVLAGVTVANPNRILLRYVLKRELLWDPCLDVVGNRLPNAFVARTGERGRAELDAVRSLAHDLGSSDGILIYPEGTTFSRAKLDASRAKLRASGRVDLADLADRMRHVLPPRVGGPLALFDAAPGLDVVVCMHTGFEGARDFSSILRGELSGKTLRVELVRIPASQVPAGDEARARWLFERWLDVDAWVDRNREPVAALSEPTAAPSAGS